MDPNSSSSEERRPAASTFGRLAGSHFQIETPPRTASLRQRRGVFNVESLELRSLGTPTNKLDEEGMAAAAAAEGTESVQESTLRKRERIAELRRRRQEQGNRAGLGAGFFDAPADAPPASPPMSLPLRTRGPESPESHEFFERSDLALLLRPVQVPDIDRLLEPPQRPPPPALGAHRRASQNGALLLPRCSAADFTINIPSTSLSPVLPQGWARTGLLVSRQQQQRRERRRLAAQQDDSDDGDDGLLPRRATPNVDREVAAQLEAELARNQQLHAELARLHLKTRKLANLVIANKNIEGAD
ncbi:hypothetical protein IWW37_003604 [Coemansia sp. RSA 2050]|nr:hypothetical protein IWW37_003604 [Coemansia sp. RSA 2050]KAJ2732496.1 hypothetical protein IW152_003772 [Coemansia sp. BCRC 34962]